MVTQVVEVADPNRGILLDMQSLKFEKLTVAILDTTAAGALAGHYAYHQGATVVFGQNDAADVVIFGVPPNVPPGKVVVGVRTSKVLQWANTTSNAVNAPAPAPAPAPVLAWEKAWIRKAQLPYSRRLREILVATPKGKEIKVGAISAQLEREGHKTTGKTNGSAMTQNVYQTFMSFARMGGCQPVDKNGATVKTWERKHSWVRT